LAVRFVFFIGFCVGFGFGFVFNFGFVVDSAAGLAGLAAADRGSRAASSG